MQKVRSVAWTQSEKTNTLCYKKNAKQIERKVFHSFWLN